MKATDINISSAMKDHHLAVRETVKRIQTLTSIHEEAADDQIKARDDERNTPDAKQKRNLGRESEVLPKDRKTTPQEASGNNKKISPLKDETLARPSRPQQPLARAKMVLQGLLQSPK